MNPTTQALDCPVCNEKINFDPQQLLMGAQFSCPACGASVGLSPESPERVRNAMEKFDKMKDRLKDSN